MSTVIWKFPLLTTDWQEIQMPKGADILTVQVQFGEPFLWARVDPSLPLYPCTFEVFGTGHEIDEDMCVERHYVGTYQLNGGSLIFHVFERI